MGLSWMPARSGGSLGKIDAALVHLRHARAVEQCARVGNAPFDRQPGVDSLSGLERCTACRSMHAGR